ncbi:MAG: nucleotidyltransferase domain-containing protein [Bacteroidetes bacterium]|nr:nucleotidyltransferase domain-containing protein [Bacteroidota bacterium]
MENTAILNYLELLVEKLTLQPGEGTRITGSVNKIKGKLEKWFENDGLKEVRAFGSYDRGTLISRLVDTNSDVDIMVIFDEKRWESQTYLNKLKNFAEEHYPKAERYQDHPSIVIEDEKIKFELVPCIYKEETFFLEEKYLVPQRQNSELEWIKTEPDYLKNKLNEFVNTKPTLINLILLFKYWNLCNSYLYKTFKIESFIINKFDYEEALDYNFFKLIDNLNYSNTDNQNSLNKVLKKQKDRIELLLNNDMEEYALLEIQKILPKIVDITKQ